MSETKAQYDIVNDFSQQCAAVMAESPERPRSFDPALLRMALITNKSGLIDGPFFKIVRVAEPLRLFCPFRYVVVTWKDIWVALTDDGKASLIGDVIKLVADAEIEAEDVLSSTNGC